MSNFNLSPDLFAMESNDSIEFAPGTWSPVPSWAVLTQPSPGTPPPPPPPPPSPSSVRSSTDEFWEDMTSTLERQLVQVSTVTVVAETPSPRRSSSSSSSVDVIAGTPSPPPPATSTGSASSLWSDDGCNVTLNQMLLAVADAEELNW
ncbi:uncharacterized protein LOC126846019 [Adelges cooleyi]|uniref:uncharacterized protein LOC126846019 n=1 Tax=Adelges cooleyi TaxID=133065 RepID=UPI0021805EAA|nr:uncharacterized protein LOC126846019 [Adelges cooleyi]